MKTTCFSLFFLIVIISELSASQIPYFELKEIAENSKWVVVAEVVRVERLSESHDRAIMSLKAEIKGNMPADKSLFSIIFWTRGMRGFDATPKVGDQGVYFLGELTNDDYHLTEFGSVALFEKHRFK